VFSNGISRVLRTPSFKTPATLFIAFVLCCLIASCDTGDSVISVNEGGAASMAFAPPTSVVASRRVIRQNLLLFVTVGDADPVAVREDRQTGLFQLTASIPPGVETVITIEWYETRIDGVEPPGLLLATASQSITPEENSPGETVLFLNDMFITSSDLDGDGRSNLDERNADTDPTDNTDPPEPVVRVPLIVRFVLPQIFEDSSSEIISNITASSQVDNQVVVLSVADNVWSGQVELTENTEALISVEFLLNSNRSVRLASRSDTAPVGGGTTVTFDADTYNLDFDDDSDQASNAEEVRDGTNPRDSSDPPTDPCAAGQFAEGCTTDSDNDGIPDSVEGETADEDRDGTPDFQESNVIDLDNDGSFAHQDEDENDPCVPSEDNMPCMDQQPVDPCAGGNFALGCTTDTDEDGEPDSEEGEFADGDMDGILDFLESDELDADNDLVPNESDPENLNPCVPNDQSPNCFVPIPTPADPCAEDPFVSGCTQDSDGDGRADSVETRTADRDEDGRPDYTESGSFDRDEDGLAAEEDPFERDPCRPNSDNSACLVAPTGPDPCIPDPFASDCTLDSDNDGKTRLCRIGNLRSGSGWSGGRA